jgi:hypothetical protein
MAWKCNGGDAETGREVNRMKAKASERAYGSAGGKNPGG